MNSDCNPNVNSPFDPDQIINLQSKVSNKVSQFEYENSEKINLSQKINLKNHVSSNHKNVAASSLNRRKKTKATQQKEKLDSHKISNLDIYSESVSNEFAAQGKPAKQPQMLPLFRNSKGSQAGKMTQPNQIQNSLEAGHPQLAESVQKIQAAIQNNLDVVQNAKKYKISMVGSDFISMRYECFCSRQYFTYCSIYNHLQREHLQFLKSNRRFSFTNVYETTHPIYGYRIKKIMRERLKCLKGQKKNQVQRLSNHVKEKIKAESHKIQALIKELRSIEDQRQQQIEMLKLLQKRFLKAGELIKEYQQMIFGFQKIFNVLNITQITRKLNSGPTVLNEQSNQQEIDYFLE